MVRKKWVELYRDAILMSAEELFEQKGYEGTSVDEIASLTGISKTTLYSYFESKELIWDALVFKYMEKILSDARKAADGEAPFEVRYYTLCFDIAARFEEHPVIYRGTLGKISVDTDQEVYRKIYETGEAINEAIADFIRSGIREGYVRKDIDIYPLVMMMWSSISGIILMAKDKEEYLKMRFDISRHEYLKKAFRMLLEGVK